MALLGSAEPTDTTRGLARVVVARRQGIWQDAYRRRMGSLAGRYRQTADRTRCSDRSRCPRRYDRGRKRPAGDLATAGQTNLRAIKTPGDLAERRYRYGLQRRRARA